jgi:hypothetical protein
MNEYTQLVDDFINNKLGKMLFTGFNTFINGIKFLGKIIKEKLLILNIHSFILNILTIMTVLILTYGILLLNTRVRLNIIYNPLQTLINVLNDNIVLCSYFILLMIFGMIHKSFIDRYTNMFIQIGYKDNNGNIPKIKNYTFFKKGIFQIVIKTSITQIYLEKYIDKMELHTGLKVLYINQLSTCKYLIEFCTNEVFDLINQEDEKEIINFKNPELTISDRLKGVFDYLDMDIHDIKAIEKVISTTIYFNSSIDVMKMNHILPEIKARLKNNSLILKIANNYQYDYMLQLIKNISQITYLKVLTEVYNDLNKYDIPLLLGVDMDGQIRHIDLKNSVHYLIGGTTGSGKTNNVHNIICTMLLSNKNISMIIIDTKKDMYCYNNIDNVLRIDVDDIDKIIQLFEMLKTEMIRRTEIYTDFKFCDSLEKYNKLSGENLPYIVIFIEEYAELLTRCNKTQSGIIEEYVKSLTQLSRSLGYKIFISTQSPRKEVLTSTIKTNCPNRQCFMVGDINESNIMLGNKNGVDISQIGQYIHRIEGKDEYLQSVYIPDNEKETIINYLEQRNVNIDKLENIEPEKITLEKKPVLKRIK